ncbi:phosphatase PAP2 family protein [Thermincola ferriacetica]
MAQVKGNLVSFLLMLSIPIINVSYVILNNPGRGVHSLVTVVDRWIPFVKVFVLPYLGWYIFIFILLCYFCFKDRQTYYTTLIALNMTLLLSYLIFYFYQTTVPRPELVGADILTRLMAFVYSKDQPYNCFPSIHVSTSYLMVKALRVSPLRNRINSVAVGIIAGIIILSTLFVKQHVILDVLGGILLADIIFDVVYNYNFAAKAAAWGKRTYAQLVRKLDLEID